MRIWQKCGSLPTLLGLLSTLLLASVAIGAPEPTTVVVQNITAIDKSGENSDRIVSIVIRDGLIDLVTQDPVHEDPSVPVFDAKQNILMGEITPGEHAHFMLLDEDPRENPAALLDTARHASFAVIDGGIVRNRLKRSVSQEPARPSWFSYSPPPAAIASNTEISERWNHYNGDKTSFVLWGAIGLDRTGYTSQNSDSVRQVGDLDSYEGGEIRGFRFGVVGRINFEHPWLYTVFGATNEFDRGFDVQNDDSFNWYDYRLDIPVFSGQTLSIGKQKEPINLERTMSMFALPFQERTIAADYFFRSRNVGAIFSGNILDRHLAWAGGVFNNGLEPGKSIDNSATIYSSRVTYAPLALDNSNLLHLGFGYRYSDGQEGFRRTATPETHSAPTFIDSGELVKADSSQSYNYELSWRSGPVWFDSEYTRVEINNSTVGELSFSGYHFATSWIVTGEMRPYNYKNGTFMSLPVSRPVNRGGWGAWELAARYSHTDATDGIIQAGNSSVYTLAVNWWLQADTNVSINWKHATLDRPIGLGQPDLQGEISALVARLTLILD